MLFGRTKKARSPVDQDFGLSLSLRLLLLHFVQLLVVAAKCDEFFVRATLHDLAFVHHAYLVGVLPQDDAVYEADCDGKPSSQVPDNTPVKQALHQIMRELNL